VASTRTRAVFTEQQDEFRAVVRHFLTAEVVPEYPEWVRDGTPSRRFWEGAAELGIPGIGVPERYGGLADSDYRHSAVVTEELHALGLAIGGLRVQTDICLPYLLHYGSAEQCAQWLPRMTAGQAVLALGLSEPGAGSDLKAMSTRARRSGDHYVVNGAKTFISNGAAAELLILAVKTDPDAGRRGISLLVVDTSTPGFDRGRKLDRLGLRAPDLAEISFTDLEVPAENLLGEENEGFAYLTSNLAQERLSIALNSRAAAAAALACTVEELRGGDLGQDAKFTLAQCAAEVAAGQALVDCALVRHVSDCLSGSDAAIAKLYCTELEEKTTERCIGLRDAVLGLHVPLLVPASHVDGASGRIYGASDEIMDVIAGQRHLR
jgi:acyl-CoA dehydrogenase